jgi:coiled-coil domain-containing protein 12
MSEQSNVGHLEDEAIKRRERLKALKKGELKTLNKNDSDLTEDTLVENVSSFPKPIFRNYKPRDEELKLNVLPRPELIDIENEIKGQLESGKPQPLIEKEIDLTTLAPQKIDWDLKREADKKLRILEKRTQKAIVELIRDRLKKQNNSDLAELVSIGSRDNIKQQEIRDMRKREVHKKGNKENSENDNEDDDDEDDDDDDEEYQNFKNQEDSNSPNISSNPSEDYLPNDKKEISDDEDY